MMRASPTSPPLREALHFLPPRPTMAYAREEAQQVMFGALDALFRNIGIKPRDISILVVNYSLFNPIPSLYTMIINHYKLRSNIKSFKLDGMGCNSGTISIDLTRDLLQAHHNSYVVVVSIENITQNWYLGNRKSMLILNCLFRVGDAAVLLSNSSADRRRSKYRPVHVVCTHRRADDNPSPSSPLLPCFTAPPPSSPPLLHDSSLLLHSLPLPFVTPR